MRGARVELAAVRALAADAGLAHHDLAADVVEADLEDVQLGVDREARQLGLAQAAMGLVLEPLPAALQLVVEAAEVAQQQLPRGAQKAARRRSLPRRALVPGAPASSSGSRPAGRSALSPTAGGTYAASAGAGYTGGARPSGVPVGYRCGERVAARYGAAGAGAGAGATGACPVGAAHSSSRNSARPAKISSSSSPVCRATTVALTAAAVTLVAVRAMSAITPIGIVDRDELERQAGRGHHGGGRHRRRAGHAGHADRDEDREEREEQRSRAACRRGRTR